MDVPLASDQLAASATAASIEKDNPAPTFTVEVASFDEENITSNTLTTAASASSGKDASNNPQTVDLTPPSELADSKESDVTDESKLDESSGDPDQKEQKTLSREMKSLINSAKDSKMISEFTQIKTKMRKPRPNERLDVSAASVGSPAEAEKLPGSRRSSGNSLVSSSSDVSEQAGRRSTRSLNPEFVSKQRKFLNKVSGKTPKDADGSHGTSDSEASEDESAATNDTTLQKSNIENAETEGTVNKLRSDKYCWRCHWVIESDGGPTPRCSLCPRAYHPRCLGGKAASGNLPSWVCPECMTILHAENGDNRSPSMQKTSLSTLCTLLNYALARMKLVNGVEAFLRPVDPAQFPDYTDYVVHPMDLCRVQQNIVDGLYGSTEAFLADTMWILHNCLVYNSPVRSRVTVAARALVRECRKEMGEIEACPECYAAAHARRPTWFTDVCSTPHILLWAKLKGFPYWPAKGMSVNESGMVDVRFFGDHDRAWVPAKYCYLYSQKDPNNARSQRNDIMESVKEAEQHVKNIIRKFGSFVHALPRTLLEPARQGDQLKMMIPGYQGALPAPRAVKAGSSNTSSPASKVKRKRTNSKGSKDFLDGYGTEEEEPVWRRKMPDGAEIAHDDHNNTPNNSVREKSIELDVATEKVAAKTRKRRRTVLEEATVFKVLEPTRKKKRTYSHDISLDKDPLSEDPEKDSLSEDPEKQTDVVIVDDDKSSATPEKAVEVINKEPDLPQDNVEKKNEKTEVENTCDTRVIIAEDHTKEPDEKTPMTNNKPDQDTTTNHTKTPEKTAENITVDNSPKTTRDRILYIDDVKPKSKQRAKKITTPEKDPSTSPEIISDRSDHLPTITNVCSLSAAAPLADKSISTKRTAKPPITVVETNMHSRIFKVSSRADNLGSMKEAVAKLQKLRDTESIATTTPTTTDVSSDSPVMQVEINIKAEPMDFDEAEKTAEKNDLLGSLNLRPTSSVDESDAAQPPNIADLGNGRRVTAVKNTMAPRARKTFPQPSRTSLPADEPRTDLNTKNSMVYIPIKPATTATIAPVRVTTGRHARVGGTASPLRTLPATNSPANSPVLNTVTMCTTVSTCGTTVSTCGTTVSTPTPMVTVATNLMPTAQSGSPAPLLPGALPPTPHPAAGAASPAPLLQNVSVLSTLNGSWTLCIPPMVNVEASSAPMVNGVGEKVGAGAGSGDASSPASTPVAVAREAPPPLQPRPGHPLDPATPIGPLPVPSVAGPVTLQINQSAVKIADYFRTLLTESLQLLDEPGAQATLLRVQLEQLAWRHKQELAELKHNTDVQVVEMRATLEREKAAAVAEARRIAEMELNAAVNHAKSKQWCANCRQEAQFYCCWNTSYCDYPCQQAHWTQHFSLCTQQRGSNEQPATCDATTVTTLGGKTVSRPLGGSALIRTSAAPGHTPGILMNMQSSGAASGAAGYKRAHFNNQPAFIINKQLMSAEETTAKLTPGGYLIVGAGNTGRPVVSHSQHNSIL